MSLEGAQEAQGPSVTAGNWQDQGIIYLDHSPNAVMHPVSVRAVKLGDGSKWNRECHKNWCQWSLKTS